MDAKRLLTIQGFATVQELNGIRSVEKVTREKKDVITSSHQFSIKVYDMETIECALVEYAEIAVERLRKQKSKCQAVQVTISTCNYYSYDINSQYSNAAIVQLPRLTSYTPDIVNAARLALPNIFRKSYGYKVVMITFLEIMPAQYQGWLWIDSMEDIKKKHLMDAVDQITDAYGRHTITLGKAFTKDGWQMKREFLSPCVTTEINNIPIVD